MKRPVAVDLFRRIWNLFVSGLWVLVQPFERTQLKNEVHRKALLVKEYEIAFSELAKKLAQAEASIENFEKEAKRLLTENKKKQDDFENAVLVAKHDETINVEQFLRWQDERKVLLVNIQDLCQENNLSRLREGKLKKEKEDLTERVRQLDALWPDRVEGTYLCETSPDGIPILTKMTNKLAREVRRQMSSKKSVKSPRRSS